jgi:hypothetical protein
MKWPIIAIIVFVIGYTLVNVYYRKPGPAYRPYQDAQDRATVSRLLAAGWHKHPVEVRRPTERPPVEGPQAKLERASPGLGLTFDEHFADKPKLLATIDRVTAPAGVTQGEIYGVYFTGAVTDLKTELGALTLYRRSNELVLVPTVEPLPGDSLLSRWNDSNYAFGFPTADLEPGTYQIRIVAQGPAIAWSFEVR